MIGIPVTIEKVTDYAAIAGYGIASTPGIVIVSIKATVPVDGDGWQG